MTRAATDTTEYARAGPVLRITGVEDSGADADGPPGAGDEALIEAARAGDRDSFARLHRRYGPLVHGVLLAHVRRQDADDLAQEVFVRAWRKIASLRDARAVGPWLAAMARRAAATHLRSGWARGFVGLFFDRPDPGRCGPEPADRAPGPDARLRADEVLAAIRSLPAAYRETVALRLVERMTGPQIAARLGMTHGSVRVNLSKGTALLRERLDAENVR